MKDHDTHIDLGEEDPSRLGPPAPESAHEVSEKTNQGKEKAQCSEVKTLPTPCRSGHVVPPTAADCPADVPGLDDKMAEVPEPGKLRLSEGAVKARMRRIFESSKITGEHKVSKAVLEQWKSKKGRGKLSTIFQSCGYCADCVGKQRIQ